MKCILINIRMSWGYVKDLQLTLTYPLQKVRILNKNGHGQEESVECVFELLDNFTDQEGGSKGARRARTRRCCIHIRHWQFWGHSLLAGDHICLLWLATCDGWLGSSSLNLKILLGGISSTWGIAHSRNIIFIFRHHYYFNKSWLLPH